MNKNFNEQALEIAIISGGIVVCYGFSGNETIIGIIFLGLAFALSILLALKVGYYILGLTVTIPVHLMVAYALISDRDLQYALADLLNKRYGYKSEQGLIVEDDVVDIEEIEEDLRQVVVQEGESFMLYDKWRTATIAIPSRFLSISEALSKLIKMNEDVHFSKERISSANLGFDKRKEEDSKMIDDFIGWLVEKGLAVSGGERKPYRLTEMGEEFY